jgi:hypothetical protein
MNVARRMARLGTESAFEVLARARQLERAGREIVHLEIGEPDFDTPAHIKDAAKRRSTRARRTTARGGAARAARGDRQARRRDARVPVAPEEVVVTPGAKPIMFFTIMALIGEGDEVIYPNPGFPIYESVINFVGGVPVPIPLREEAASASTWTCSSSRCRRRRSSSSSTRRRTRPAACSTGPDRAHRADRGERNDPGADRRDLPPVPLRGRVRVDLRPAGHARAHDPPRRLLEVVRR